MHTSPEEDLTEVCRTTTLDLQRKIKKSQGSNQALPPTPLPIKKRGKEANTKRLLEKWVTFSANVLTGDTDRFNGLSSERNASYRRLRNTASHREARTLLVHGPEPGRLSSAQNHQPRSEVRDHNGLWRRTFRDSTRSGNASGFVGPHGSQHHNCEVLTLKSVRERIPQLERLKFVEVEKRNSREWWFCSVHRSWRDHSSSRKSGGRAQDLGS